MPRRDRASGLARVSAKGWVVIPAALRHKYGLTPGALVEITEEDDQLVLRPAMLDPIRGLHGILAGGKSLTRALLDERAREVERESRRE